MIIDIMPDMSIQQLPNIQQEKKGDGVGPRSIEESGDGNKSEFDTDKQNATKKIYTKNLIKNISSKTWIYNAKGNISEEGPAENKEVPSFTIDMTV